LLDLPAQDPAEPDDDEALTVRVKVASSPDSQTPAPFRAPRRNDRALAASFANENASQL